MLTSLRWLMVPILVCGCGGGEAATRCPTETIAVGAQRQAVEDGETEVSPPAEVRVREVAPRRVSPNGQAWITLLAQGANAFVGRLEMAPGATVPEHRDPTEEYIHILSGGGTLVIDGVEHEIGPGTTVFMPSDVTVSYRNGAERLVALQVFAGPEAAEKYERWTAEATPQPRTAP